MTTLHPQIEIDGTEVDTGLAVLLTLVWKHGLNTRESCEGDAEHPAYIVFPELKDAGEFLLQSAHLTHYLMGDNLAMTIQHPAQDITTPPEGKVTWLPELTHVLQRAWAGTVAL